MRHDEHEGSLVTRRSRRRLRHPNYRRYRVPTTLAILGLLGAVLATSGNVLSAQEQWRGFSVTTLDSGQGAGTSPAWGLGVTEDLGGPGVDVWNNNHGLESEAIIDLAAANPGIRSAESYGAPNIEGPDTHGVAFSDIDGDGDEDLFEVSGRNNPNRLFRNDGGQLQFVDPAGLEDFFGRGRQPLFFDFDNDGDMDVLITNLDLRSDPVPQDERQLKPSELYLNNGDGTQWTKVADPNEIITDGHVRIAQLTSTGPATPNIVVTHDVFTLARDSVAVGTGVLSEPTNPATRRTDNSKPIREVIVGDFDNDLHPEFITFVGNASVSAGNWPIQAFEVSSAGNARQVSLPQSSDLDNCRSGAAADFDNDGDLDILAGCAQREEGQNRNVVLLNDGFGNFTDAGTNALPLTIAETPGAIVAADVDSNGWVDVIVANGYDFDRAPDQVFGNQGADVGSWLALDLTGANPDASGAQVFVGAGDGQWQVRETGHRNHRSQDERTLHFGLGDADAIAPILVRWADGTYESCSVNAINARVGLVKGSPICQSVTRDAFLQTLDSAPAVVSPPTPPPTTTATTTTTPTAPVVTTTPPAGSPALVCNGLAVTVDLGSGESPTAGDDVIRGTSAADVIDGLGGRDVICSLGGDDTINGGAGFDQVFAGQGDDTIDGGSGNDFLVGGPGNDSIIGGNGNDRLQGGDGVDNLSGDGGFDRLAGGNGNDTLRGGIHDDELLGNLGRDLLFGDNGNDVLRGGAWLDTFDGGDGNDGCTLSDPSGNVEPRTSCETGVFGR